MFKFLFGGKRDSVDPVPETDRERFKRLATDLNELIDTLPVKPKITFDPESGHVTLEEPEQFPDEALALPAPEAAKAEETPKDNADAAGDETPDVEQATGAPQPPKPSPPKANPPQPRTP